MLFKWNFTKKMSIKLHGHHTTPPIMYHFSPSTNPSPSAMMLPYVISVCSLPLQCLPPWCLLIYPDVILHCNVSPCKAYWCISCHLPQQSSPLWCLMMSPADFSLCGVPHNISHCHLPLSNFPLQHLPLPSHSMAFPPWHMSLLFPSTTFPPAMSADKSHHSLILQHLPLWHLLLPSTSITFSPAMFPIVFSFCGAYPHDICNCHLPLWHFLLWLLLMYPVMSHFARSPPISSYKIDLYSGSPRIVFDW